MWGEIDSRSFKVNNCLTMSRSNWIFPFFANPFRQKILACQNLVWSCQTQRPNESRGSQRYWNGNLFWFPNGQYLVGTYPIFCQVTLMAKFHQARKLAPKFKVRDVTELVKLSSHLPNCDFHIVSSPRNWPDFFNGGPIYEKIYDLLYVVSPNQNTLCYEKESAKESEKKPSWCRIAAALFCSSSMEPRLVYFFPSSFWTGLKRESLFTTHD